MTRDEVQAQLAKVRAKISDWGAEGRPASPAAPELKHGPWCDAIREHIRQVEASR